MARAEGGWGSGLLFAAEPGGRSAGDSMVGTREYAARLRQKQCKIAHLANHATNRTLLRFPWLPDPHLARENVLDLAVESVVRDCGWVEAETNHPIAGFGGR